MQPAQHESQPIQWVTELSVSDFLPWKSRTKMYLLDMCEKICRLRQRARQLSRPDAQRRWRAGRTQTVTKSAGIARP